MWAFKCGPVTCIPSPNACMPSVYKVQDYTCIAVEYGKMYEHCKICPLNCEPVPRIPSLSACRSSAIKMARMMAHLIYEGRFSNREALISSVNAARYFSFAYINV